MARKLIRLLVCILAVIVILSIMSSYFLEISHTCTGEKCQVCLAIQSLRGMLEGLLLLSFAAIAPCLTNKLWRNLKQIYRLSACQNLVSLKVKLSD